MRVFIIGIILLIASTVTAAPFQGSQTSGEQTADALIYTVVNDNEAYLTSIVIMTDGANDATAVLYDNTSAAGTVLWTSVVAALDNYGGKVWVFPVEITTGLYLDLTGTGASAIVEYIK